jgi:hypothetical protein
VHLSVTVTVTHLVANMVASGSGFLCICSAVFTIASAPAFDNMNWVSTLGVPWGTVQ